MKHDELKVGDKVRIGLSFYEGSGHCDEYSGLEGEIEEMAGTQVLVVCGACSVWVPATRISHVVRPEDTDLLTYVEVQ